ncbi:Bug family tripartite tricarboxylate transporter substrate binding protein [Roseococcus sp.]|uniref:Bug family tripartite tricarboxylate transporter substrate binding protein n=1 Tax=Roseococcus sp. TaxID=2109646 RepID=UPI003BA9382E
MQRRLLLTGLATMLASRPVLAQEAAPPLRIVVPFPPGGSYDVVARLIQVPLAARLRRNIVIENRGGAGGNLGAEAVARAAPDGNTVLLWGDGVLSNAALYRNLPWDPLRDFAPVAMVADSPVIIAARAGGPSLAELIATGKRDRRGYSFGTAGNGSPGHIAGALLGRMTGVEFQHIPYRGGAPALADLLGGQIDLASNPLPAVIPFIQGGQLSALAVAGERRMPQIPEVPTVGELLPGFAVNSWYGVLAPARTPPAAVTALSEALIATARDPAVVAALNAQGFTSRTLDPEALGAFLRTEAPRWREMVALSGAAVE